MREKWKGGGVGGVGFVGSGLCTGTRAVHVRELSGLGLHRLAGVGVERTGALPWVLRMRALGATQGVSFAVIIVITVVGACNGDRKQSAESSWERESPYG